METFTETTTPNRDIKLSSCPPAQPISRHSQIRQKTLFFQLANNPQESLTGNFHYRELTWVSSPPALGEQTAGQVIDGKGKQAQSTCGAQTADTQVQLSLLWPWHKHMPFSALPDQTPDVTLLPNTQTPLATLWQIPHNVLPQLLHWQPGLRLPGLCS